MLDTSFEFNDCHYTNVSSIEKAAVHRFLEHPTVLYMGSTLLYFTRTLHGKFFL